jgi:hypothetical protein
LKVGRNDSCPCGSGKKYKKCCVSLEQKNSNDKDPGGFEFTPGSYGDVGQYFPSIACKKQSGEYHFVLIRPDLDIDDEDEAVIVAENDLEVAFRSKENSGTDQTFALELKNKGYIKVDDYNIVNSTRNRS